MAFTLRQIRIFTIIVQCGSITGASAQLFLSKPAVSMALSDLEDRLGRQLFDRVNQRLILNLYGKKLLPLADEMLVRASAINYLFNDAAMCGVPLKVGASVTIGNHLLPFLLRDFRGEAGHQSQTLVVDNSKSICDQINQFELDVGLIEAKVNYPDLTVKPWLMDQMVVICSHNHPLAKKKKVSMADLEGCEWILREEGSGTRDFFMNNFGNKLNSWSQSLVLNNTQSIINAVSAEFGIACLGEKCVSHVLDHYRLKVLNLSLDMSRQYWLVYHREKYQLPVFEKFIEFVGQWSEVKII